MRVIEALEGAYYRSGADTGRYLEEVFAEFDRWDFSLEEIEEAKRHVTKRLSELNSYHEIPDWLYASLVVLTAVLCSLAHVFRKNFLFLFLFTSLAMAVLVFVVICLLKDRAVSNRVLSEMEKLMMIDRALEILSNEAKKRAIVRERALRN